MKEAHMSSARAGNMVASSDYTTYVFERINVMHDHAYPFYYTLLRFCTVILLKSKTTDTKDPHTYIFKLK